jgi:glucose-1-phosphatase
LQLFIAMQNIKNIIFDLGGVLLNVDYHKTTFAFQELGVRNFDDLFSQFRSNDLFEKLETGNISDESFYEEIKNHCSTGTTSVQIEEAWNAMLLDFRKDSLDFLSSLQNKYNLYLLSNTNSIHLSAFKKIFTDETGLESLDTFFRKSYYSHLIQRRKPHKETYRFVLQDENMNAGQTLFVDDSINNIEAAKELGIITHLLLPDERIEDLHI